jgi:hypothetical protein
VRENGRLTGGRKGYITETNGRSSWEREGIVAFCTCRWNEWKNFSSPPSASFHQLPVLVHWPITDTKLDCTSGVQTWEETIQCRFICRRMLISITVSELRKCCIPISVVYKGFIPAASNSNHTWGKHLPIKN